MKIENIKKYIGDLSPELQEKARECKTMEELQAMLAENDVELSEDALEAVSGGCSSSGHHCSNIDLEKDKVLFWQEALWVVFYKRQCKDCGKISYACVDYNFGRYADLTEQQYIERYCPFVHRRLGHPD